jgi:hypothetical protein
MANQLFSPGREGFSLGEIDWDADDIRVMLVLATYTFDAADKFLADLGAVDNGRSAALTGKVAPNGVHDADDTSLTATAAAASKGFAVFKHTGSDATARLICFDDGKILIIIAADAAGSATALWCEVLLGALASGLVLTKISGTGPSTITLSAGASAGARALAVSAISGAITAGAVYEGAVTGSGLPFTPAVGGTVNVVFDSGSNRIFKL